MHVHGGGPAVVRNDLEDIAEAGISIGIYILSSKL